MHARMAPDAAVHDEEPLLGIGAAQPVERRGVVRREDYLLVVLLGQLDDLLHQLGAELGVERRIDVIDGEERRRVGADEEGEVEEEEEEAFVGAALIEERTLGEVVVPDIDSVLEDDEVFGDLKAIGPTEESEPLDDLGKERGAVSLTQGLQVSEEAFSLHTE